MLVLAQDVRSSDRNGGLVHRITKRHIMGESIPGVSGYLQSWNGVSVYDKKKVLKKQ